MLALLVLPALPGAEAQSLPSAADALRMLQERQGGGNTDEVPDLDPTARPSVQTFTPAALPAGSAPSSHLEEAYSRRASDTLQQFGYDALGVPSAVSITQSGAIPDGYVLGRDDELVISLRGQENSSYRVRVDRDGRVTLPRLAPILAAGRRFGDFRADVESQVGRAYLSTQVFVTIGNIHQLSILVAGEVRAPGVRTLSALASPLDAILLSGGVKKTGSLRNVKVISAGTTRTIDLYSIVAEGRSGSLGSLRDGDRIYIPPLGPTAAVSGSVARPAIYELPPGVIGMRVSELLRLAGGPAIAAAYTLSKIDVRRDGTLSLDPTTRNGLVRDGEVLVVSETRGGMSGRVWMRGEIVAPGVRPLSTIPTIGAAFRSARDLTPFAYTPLALVRRRDPVTNSITLIPVSLTAVIRHAVDLPLQDDDTVFILSRRQMSALASLVTKDVNSAYEPPGVKDAKKPGTRDVAGQADDLTLPSESGAAPSALSSAAAALAASNPAVAAGGLRRRQEGGFGDDLRFRSAGQADNTEAAALASAQALGASNGINNAPATQRSDDDIVDEVAGLVGVTPDALQRLAVDNLVWVMNEVREPGPYLAGSGTSIDDMVQAAGGPQQRADLSSIEVTSTLVDQRTGATHTTRQNFAQADGQMALASIRPMDVIRLRSVYTDRDEGTVSVAGEVRFPGVFDITRDERLSSLLQRAGGVSEVAYPYGAIFTRKNAALAEKEGYERTARQLESQIPTLLAKQGEGEPGQTATSQYLSTLARNLRDTPALGRIVITADPTVLATRPELDFVLQPGDTLYIPKRPSDVTVSGEVLNTGSFQYRAGLRYSDYIRLAGGETQQADDSRIFIVLPDGSATPIGSDWLSFGGGSNIPPGSTIVIPRDIAPFSWSQFVKDAAQIVSQLAISAASLAVLNRNSN
ncbi:MAG: SLBB domain-containing protein [Rhizomicrobium sp.]